MVAQRAEYDKIVAHISFTPCIRATYHCIHVTGVTISYVRSLLSPFHDDERINRRVVN